MGSILLFYWLRMYYPVLTNSSDFMVEKFDEKTRKASYLKTFLAIIIFIGHSIPAFMVNSNILRQFYNENTRLFVVIEFIWSSVWLILTFAISLCFFYKDLKADKQIGNST